MCRNDLSELFSTYAQSHGVVLDALSPRSDR